MHGRRTRTGALALLLALVALPLLAGCGGPDFSDFTGDLQFGDEQVADTQVTDVMHVPDGGLGRLIGDAQIEWVRCGQGRGQPVRLREKEGAGERDRGNEERRFHDVPDHGRAPSRFSFFRAPKTRGFVSRSMSGTKAFMTSTA